MNETPSASSAPARYRAMSTEEIRTALEFVKDPDKLAALKIVARDRGLLPEEPVADAARGEEFIRSTFGAPRPDFF